MCTVAALKLLLCARAVSHRCGTARLCTSARQVRVRFAPSPTGHLHLGGLRTALYNYLFARASRGRFIVRVEDTDQARLVPGAVEKLVENLEWTGIQIDEGPLHGGNYGPYTQSERISIYQEHIQQLLKFIEALRSYGNEVYPNGTAYHCFCSPKRLDLLRKEALRQGETPKYDNRCRHLSSEEVAVKLASDAPFTIRFKLSQHTEPWTDLVYGPIITDVASIEGDPILMKTDGFPTYHFANVVDDHTMDISHVLRGVEWQVSTTKHILLYKAFGWTAPHFAHLPLLLNRDGKKLSKRHGDIHVENYKEKGVYPEAVINLLTNVGSGFKVKDTAGMTLEQLISHFDLGEMSTHSTRVDLDRLKDFNQLHLHQKLDSDTDCQQVAAQVKQLVQEKYGHRLESSHLGHSVLSEEYINHVLHWSKTRIHHPQDLLRAGFEFLWSLPSPESLHGVDVPSATSMLEVTEGALCQSDEQTFSQGELNQRLKDISETHGWTLKHYMQLLRASLSGLKEGPSVAEIMQVLGRDAVLQRLQNAINELHKNTQHSS